LSYKNVNELNKIIGSSLPSRLMFKHDKVFMAGKAFEFYSRDILDCVCMLYSDPEFVPYLAFAPEHHYVDEERSKHAYNEMHTGDWWLGWHTGMAWVGKVQPTPVPMKTIPTAGFTRTRGFL